MKAEEIRSMQAPLKESYREKPETALQLAARLCSHAQPEQILVSSVVAELCIGKQLTFTALGEVPLKGFENPVRIHAVDWTNESGQS